MSDKKRTRSRSEVKVAFENLDIPNGMSEKEAELFTAATIATRSSISDLVVEKAAQAVTAASLANQKALSSINEELVNNLQILQNVKSNIKLESEELVRLYGARTISEHLDVLKAEHDEAKAALEKEIVETRSAWAREQSDQAQARSREADSFAYNLKIQRKSDDDAWKEQLRLRGIEEETRRAELEKGWAVREEALKLREKELAELKLQVEGFPKLLEAEANKRVGAATGAMKKDHEHEVALLKAAAASDKALLEAQINSVKEALEREKTLSTALRTELAEANKKNAEIATKALDSTSSRELATTLQAALKDQSNGGSARKS